MKSVLTVQGLILKIAFLHPTGCPGPGGILLSSHSLVSGIGDISSVWRPGCCRLCWKTSTELEECGQGRAQASLSYGLSTYRPGAFSLRKWQLCRRALNEVIWIGLGSKAVGSVRSGLGVQPLVFLDSPPALLSHPCSPHPALSLSPHPEIATVQHGRNALP